MPFSIGEKKSKYQVKSRTKMMVKLGAVTDSRQKMMADSIEQKRLREEAIRKGLMTRDGKETAKGKALKQAQKNGKSVSISETEQPPDATSSSSVKFSEDERTGSKI